jgi:hypothetical protein
MISARVIGREMSPALDSNPMLKQRILSILKKNTHSEEESRLGKLLLPVLFGGSGNLGEIKLLPQEIINGIQDSYSAPTSTKLYNRDGPQ